MRAGSRVAIVASMRVLAVVCLFFARAAFADCEDEPPPPAHDQLTLTKASFAELPGWKDEHPAEAVPSFVISCTQLAELADGDPVGADGHGGLAKQWRHACAAASKLKAGDRDYGVLDFLLTKPRLTYLAKVRNPNPAMPDFKADEWPRSLREFEERTHENPFEEEGAKGTGTTGEKERHA